MYKKNFRTHKVEVWFLFIMLSLIWGSSFILIKKGLVVFSPEQVGTMRIVFAFLFLLPAAVRNLKKISKDKWKVVFFTGMIGNFIPSILFSIAETGLESSLTGILNALTPLFALIIAVLLFNHRLRIIQISGLLIGFIGTVGLSFVSARGEIGQMNMYVWFVIIATVCYGISLNIIKNYLQGINSIVITSLALLTVGPIAVIYLLTTDFIYIVINSPGAFEALFFIALLGIFGTAIALILYTKLIHLTSAVFASFIAYLIPVVAILWGWLDNESLYALHFIGMVMILLGIYLVNKSEDFSKKNEQYNNIEH
ncbi:MAG: DMT family transporter [bacterium]|nr:DMT family transporter [bacterium]